MIAHIQTHFFSWWSQGHGRPYRTVMVLLVLLLAGILLAVGANETFANPQPVTVILDTDMGVDDAAAVGWLLSQTKFPVQVLGITTVGGNTTVENVANNTLTILDVVGRNDIPVVIGAAQPLSQTFSATGALSHGPDGFWFAGYANPHDLSGLSTDAPGFICSHAAAGVKLVTLGPLTNVANALDSCPAQMQLFDEIVVLGGAKGIGNSSAVAEFNLWFDPEAADQLFRSTLMPRLITQNAFQEFTITMDDVAELATDGTPTGQFLANILQPYVALQTGLGGSPSASIPDVTAVMVALNSQVFVRTEQTALIKMVPGIVGEPNPERLVRGQAIIGLTLGEKIPMIADDFEMSSLAQRAFTEPDFDLEAEIGAILMREPDNGNVILTIRKQTMYRFFMQYLTN